ncbi:MAG: septum formation protein Maf [Clostridiales bacterium]|nr:septum formation protein Maf [Clostridiales bacterium]
MERIYLASSSPRRKELLEMAGIPFEVIKNDIDERIDPSTPLTHWAQKVAEKKAVNAISKVSSPSIVVSADTIVVLDGRLLQKPKNKTEAIEMLTFLSGQTHTVYTGVAILYKKTDGTYESDLFTCTTDVTMYQLSRRLIEQYVSTGEPVDKAGAYGIQQKGSCLVRSIHGDYFTVVGLPIGEVCRKLQAHAVDFTENWSIL